MPLSLLFSLAIAVLRAELRRKAGSNSVILLIDEAKSIVDKDIGMAILKVIDVVLGGHRHGCDA